MGTISDRAAIADVLTSKLNNSRVETLRGVNMSGLEIYARTQIRIEAVRIREFIALDDNDIIVYVLKYVNGRKHEQTVLLEYLSGPPFYREGGNSLIN